jgi:L-rhamnose mutarotase
MKLMKAVLIGMALALLSSSSIAAESYTEGHVVGVSYIKVKPGMYDAYMKYLDTDYKRLMEAHKKAGLIVDYAVYATEARTPQEPNLILMTTYTNMAALDRTEEADAVTRKVFGDEAKVNKGTVDRGAMRDPVGTQLMRQLILK